MGGEASGGRGAGARPRAKVMSEKDFPGRFGRGLGPQCARRGARVVSVVRVRAHAYPPSDQQQPDLLPRRITPRVGLLVAVAVGHHRSGELQIRRQVVVGRGQGGEEQ